jgi:hypothetical protein
VKTWIIRLVTTYLLKNWRTTLTGAIGFLVTQFPQTRDWLGAHGYSIDAVQGFLLMVVAFLAKDGSVTNSPAPVPAQFVSNSEPDAPVLGG